MEADEAVVAGGGGGAIIKGGLIQPGLDGSIIKPGDDVDSSIDNFRRVIVRVVGG